MDALLIAFLAMVVITAGFGVLMAGVVVAKIMRRNWTLRKRRNSLPSDDGIVHAVPLYGPRYPELRLRLW